MAELVAQRVLALACGYEDLNDHDVLRDDALLAVAAGKRDATGERRRRKQDRGHALAGKSTLNRLELTPAERDARARYKKIVCDGATRSSGSSSSAFLVGARERAPREIVLDLDATDDPLHGQQEGRFFHGYYGATATCRCTSSAGTSCWPRKLRRADQDGAAGAVEEVARIVAQIRERWPAVRIVVRADSGFARDELMAWCEANGVDYVLGLARNDRLRGGDRRRRWREARREHRGDRGSRRASTRTSATGRARAGAARGAWSARPSTCRGRRIRASW